VFLGFGEVAFTSRLISGNTHVLIQQSKQIFPMGPAYGHHGNR
jgi:hypothetical protein